MSAPLGPYTPIVRAGDWFVTSGQVGVGPNGLVAGGFEAELHQVLANLGGLLEDHGLRRDQVVKTTVFVTDIGDFARLNEIYLAWFGDHRPARSAVAVAALPAGACVEIEAWILAPAAPAGS